MARYDPEEARAVLDRLNKAMKNTYLDPSRVIEDGISFEIPHYPTRHVKITVDMLISQEEFEKAFVHGH